ncbi:MAG: methyltransferase [Gemmiger sp.]|nr:methyltransferase [Gemmiger sp.]
MPEILDNGTLVLTEPGATFGTDALLLARFVQPRRGDAVADLCSGCGIVALAWHDAGHRGPCTAVELEPAASALCAAAVAQNGPEAAHIHPLCADVRAFCQAGPQRGRYALMACNPPYFTGGPRAADPRRATARHADSCTLADVAACGARGLHDGGKLVLCHTPAQLAATCAALSAVRLEPKRIALVKNANGGPPWLFLLEAQKNRRPGLRWEPDILISAGSALYGPGRR